MVTEASEEESVGVLNAFANPTDDDGGFTLLEEVGKATALTASPGRLTVHLNRLATESAGVKGNCVQSALARHSGHMHHQFNARRSVPPRGLVVSVTDARQRKVVVTAFSVVQLEVPALDP